jgi:hypothetical protein
VPNRPRTGRGEEALPATRVHHHLHRCTPLFGAIGSSRIRGAACIELHCGDAVDLEVPAAANGNCLPQREALAVLDELAALRCVVSNKSFSLYRQAGQEAVVPLEEARPVDMVPAA